MTETEKIAAVVVTAVKAAQAPLLEEIGRLKAVVAVLEARAPMAGPAGENGIDGVAGPIGPAGDRGESGPQGPQGEKGVDGTLGPRGEKGLDGVAGERGGDGPQGMAGRDGLPGVQGPAGDRGEKGLDGRDGRDGSLENLKAAFDGERTLTLCFKDGTPIDGGIVKFAIPIYRGVYVAGKTYERGDSVTFGGSQWIAHEDTEAKPAEGKAWQLAVRAGRDGREGKQGPEGQAGPKGTPGAPGRDYR